MVSLLLLLCATCSLCSGDCSYICPDFFLPRRTDYPLKIIVRFQDSKTTLSSKADNDLSETIEGHHYYSGLYPFGNSGSCSLYLSFHYTDMSCYVVKKRKKKKDHTERMDEHEIKLNRIYKDRTLFNTYEVISHKCQYNNM